MTPLMIAILRAVHVVAGSFWLGALLLNAGFLLPAVNASGPAGGQVVKYMVQVRRLPTFMNTAVVFSLLTGGALFWWVSGGFSIAWLSSGLGAALSTGGLLAIVAAALGQFVNAPTARRFGQFASEVQAAGGPPPEAMLAEMRRLQLRLLRATQFGAILLVLSAASMAAARYVLL